MKAIKSLILTLILAGATYAGDMPMFDTAPAPPPPASQNAPDGAIAQILAAIVQNLLIVR